MASTACEKPTTRSGLGGGFLGGGFFWGGFWGGVLWGVEIRAALRSSRHTVTYDSASLEKKQATVPIAHGTPRERTRKKEKRGRVRVR